jgi:3-hydroxyisobutyrate dehydrogenase-like beta-hydroxyacid dehydrogenase
MRVAVLGLGEAGGRYAADLAAAGWQVSGYDPAPVRTPPGVLRATSAGAAAARSDLVIGLTGPAAAVAAAVAAAPAMRAGSCYADLNSAPAAAKREVEAALAGAGGTVEMADVAVLAPVGRRGAATPLLVSGPGARAVARAFRAVGAEVEVVEAAVGAAAERKLLRSVFMKALAAAVLEATTAARAAGCEPWLREQIAAELGPGGHGLVDRLIDGSARHAVRRISEVEASRTLLRDLGVPTPACDAALTWLALLRDDPVRSS